MSDNVRFYETRHESYNKGYRDGYLDCRYLSFRSVIALTAPDKDYATGYHDGHLGLERNPPLRKE